MEDEFPYQVKSTLREDAILAVPMVMFIHHVPEYVRRTGVQLGPTSEQALASQHRFFDISYHKYKVNCTNSPALDNVYFSLYNIITRAICK